MKKEKEKSPYQKDLRKDLEQFFTANRLKEEMSYDYGSENLSQKAEIRKALIFWDFVKYRFEDKPDLFCDRIEFLEDFTTHRNPYLALVAKTEMLPTLVWEKILWRYNIDYSSLENFLRRIFFEENADQREAIQVNWNDIYVEKKQPRVLKKRFWDRLGQRVYLAMKWLGLGKYVPNFTSFEGERLSKVAWAYNFIGLDFGFALYPFEGSDEKETLTADSPLGDQLDKVLSKKAHENDFATNNVDGIYWFLYRFLCTWGFMLFTRKVKLNGWVCPSFWATVIGVPAFLALPFLSLVLTPLIGIWAWIISLPTLLWAFFWVLVVVGVLIGGIGYKIWAKVYPAVKKRSKTLSRFLIVGSAGVLSLGGFMLVGLIAVILRKAALFALSFIKLFIASFPLYFTLPLAVVAVVVLGLLVLRIPVIRNSNATIKEITKLPWLKYMLLALGGLVVILLGYYFVSELVSALGAIWNVLKAIVSFLVVNWAYFVAPLVWIGALSYFVGELDKDYDTLALHRNRLVFVALVAIVDVLLFSFGVTHIWGLEFFLILPFLYGILFVIALTEEAIIDKRRKDEVVSSLKECSCYLKINTELRNSLYTVMRDQNVSPAGVRDKVSSLWYYVRDFSVYLGDDSANVFNFIFRKAKSLKWDLVENKDPQVRRDLVKHLENIPSAYRKNALLFYLQGKTWEEIEVAVAKLKKEDALFAEKKQKREERKAKRRARRKKISSWFASLAIWNFFRSLWYAVTRPFVWVWCFFVWIWKTVAKLKFIYKEMEEYCPRNTPRKAL
ncbi:MAG: hypothetical protein LBO09_05800 [Candidatus Peribacteria bacterium]|jgi:hypothetical protein|nr:hypothetical protein [Candidatus Peribacteria bacterium]